MALVKSSLEQEFFTFVAKDHPTFQDFPKNAQEVAQFWTDAIMNYASAVTPPVTPPATQSARTALYNALLAGASMNTFTSALTSGMSSMASALAGGMSPTFTGVPPPAPLNISPVISAGMNGASGETCSVMLATIIDTWMRTGTATNTSSGATTVWA